MVKVEPAGGVLVTLISPPDCLAKPSAWLRPRPVPLPTSLVVKNGSKMASSMSAGIPDPVSVTETATNRPSRRAWPRSTGMASTASTWMTRLPSSRHRIAGIDGEIDQRGFELRDVGGGKTGRIAQLDLDLDPAAHQRADQLRDAFDLRADIEHLRRQRLPPGKGQQLAGQLRGAIDRVRNRIDVTAAPVLAEIAAAQEVGRGAYDGEKIVEIVRDAAGQLADRIHLLGLAQRLLGLPPLGDVDGLGQHPGDGAVLIEHRTHGEIEKALAGGKIELHFPPDAFAPHHRRKGLHHDFAHSLRCCKPRRIPKRLSLRRPICWPGFRPAPSHWRRQRCPADPAAPDTGCWSRRSRASALRWTAAARCAPRSAAPAFRSGSEARIRLPWPTVMSWATPMKPICFPVGSQRGCDSDRIQRHCPSARRYRPSSTNGFSVASPGNALLHDAVHVIRMQDFPPVERQPFVVGNAQKFQIGLVGEGAGAVDLGDPHRHRRAVGDQAKPLFALAQRLPGKRKIGDVDVRADQPQRPAVGIAFDPGFGGYPADLSVIRPDDAILR